MIAFLAFGFGVSLAIIGVGIYGWYLQRHHSESPAKDDRAADADTEESDLGEKIDFALSNYNRLLENDCKQTLILEIALQRVEDTHRKMEAFKQRKFEATVTK